MRRIQEERKLYHLLAKGGTISLKGGGNFREGQVS